MVKPLFRPLSRPLSRALDTWTPAGLGSTVIAWWRSVSLSGADGATLDTWYDTVSSRALNGGGGTASPTAQSSSGKKYLAFDGSNDIMTTAHWAALSSASVTVGVRFRVPGAAVYSIIERPYVADLPWRVAINGAGAAGNTSGSGANVCGLGMYKSGDPGYGYSGNSSVTANTWTTAIASFNSGTLLADCLIGVSSTSQTLVQSITHNTQPLTVGRNTVTLAYSAIDLAEVVICDTDLSAANKVLLRTYLNGVIG